ncbi:MAG: hypothetical protein A2136_06875 [Chloroflexi bacterium RBG_16_54_11]|nr:MAG: hypothetical protein A2136_06875 [Chloroflexi bacterium RBG_16_54_11]
MLEFVVFLLGSTGIVFLSRHAPRNFRSHGFPRFFALESILGLAVLNARSWFFNPFSLPQLVSWTLLLASVFLAALSIHYLRRFGAPDKTIPDGERLAFEKTTQLVTMGPYHFIRHPMYAALLYLAWGIMLKQINLISTLLAVIASLVLFLTAVYEEQENLQNFGVDYAAYMKRTKRFIPLVL